ncbi:hypothetical protein CDAR_23031 [Caerostris darwini]|uniref:Uncharacterized protein n=1 Tax=Caerostris darwini TaxID=1538125 RepID=A0AAV4SC63_9ARAC|nr:hypothetical protein CDAR_23031 [Caerostris darwini]
MSSMHLLPATVVQSESSVTEIWGLYGVWLYIRYLTLGLCSATANTSVVLQTATTTIGPTLHPIVPHTHFNRRERSQRQHSLNMDPSPKIF